MIAAETAKRFQVAGWRGESRQAGPGISGVGPLPGLSPLVAMVTAAGALALVLAVPVGTASATSSQPKTVKVSTAKVAGIGTVLTTALV